MSYSFSTILKAVGAAVVAFGAAGAASANGVDLSHLDLGQWLGIAGAAATAAAAIFHTPTKTGQAPVVSAAEQAVTTITDVAAAAQTAHGDLTQAAVNSIKAVQDAVGELTGAVLPGPLGPLATEVIKNLPVSAPVIPHTPGQW